VALKQGYENHKKFSGLGIVDHCRLRLKRVRRRRFRYCRDHSHGAEFIAAAESASADSSSDADSAAAADSPSRHHGAAHAAAVGNDLFGGTERGQGDDQRRTQHRLE